MPSTWGKRHGLPGYDEFRIGMSYKEAYDHLRVSKKHRFKRKGSVLGYMHEVKLMLYYHAVDRGYLEHQEMERALKVSEKLAKRRGKLKKRRPCRPGRRAAA